MTVPRLVWPALVLAACLPPAAARAQEYPLVRDHPGSWSEPDVRGAPMPPAARAAALQVARQIIEILRRMPVMEPAPGFQVVQHTYLSLANIDHSDDAHLPQLVTLKVTANIAPYERTPSGVSANERDTAASVTVVVNDFAYSGATAMGDPWTDDQGAFIQSPEDPVETRHGFPVYQEGNGDAWLLMRRHEVPLLMPVTRERYLRSVTKQLEDELAKAQGRRAKIPAGVPADIVAEIDSAIAQETRHLANLRQQSQQMSAGDRRLPAIIGTSTGEEPVAFAGGGDGTAVFFFNPALIDSALPPATPQALSIRLLSNAELGAGLGERLDRELDWNALAALLR